MTILTVGDVLAPIIPDWPAPPGVHAACSTRGGGVSSGPYAGLNVGRSGGDESSAVDENRRRLVAALRLPGAPQWLRQVHGSCVVQMPADPPEPDADGCFTRQRRTVCAVQAADCLPVLFCDDAGSVVAAAHAGWRGLVGGVLEATVAALPVAPRRLMAWLGPAIGPEAFEVGEEVREAFTRKDAGAAAAFRAGAVPGKHFGDLFLLARRRLAAAGVRRVYGGGLSTHADPARFYSFRRDGVCGRMAALIWLD
ncbi:MAG: peptidoglycan editing factor PgeF [Nevskia sp.]